MQSRAPYLLSAQSNWFPDASLALNEPDGLLAIGGDLSANRLISAYKQGIFPWFNQEAPLLWWSPSERMILLPNQFRLSRSLKKRLKKNYIITVNQAFSSVINQCANIKRSQHGTWICQKMIDAYTNLHCLGHAHSVEVWHQEELVGGLYGIAIGQGFFGESMFHIHRDASKIALLSLCCLPIQFDFIDCQLHSPHLASLGANPMNRNAFLKKLDKTINKTALTTPWPISPIDSSELNTLFKKDV